MNNESKNKSLRIVRSILLLVFAMALSLPNGSVSAEVKGTTPAPAGSPQVITPENIRGIHLLHWFGQGAYTGSVAQQPNGSLLAAVTSSGVALLDRQSGEQTGFIPIGLQPTALSISPAGTTLAIVVNYPSGKLGGFMGLPVVNQQIQLYTLPDGNPKGQPITDLGECANSNIWDIAFTPDGAELVFEKKYGVNDDKDVRKFCVASLTEGKVTRTKEMAKDSSMVISPDGEVVASVDKQGSRLSIFSTHDFSLVHEFEISPSDYPEFSFSSSGQYLGLRTFGEENSNTPPMIQIWSLANGKLLYSGSPSTKEDSFTAFEVDEDSGTIYLGTQFGWVEIVSADSGKVTKQLGPFTWTAYSLTGNPAGATSFEQPAMIKSIILSADRQELIVSENLTTYGQPSAVHLFQLPGYTETHTFRGASAGSESLEIAFSPDSSRLALTGTKNGNTEVYDVQSGQLILDLAGHTKTTNQVRFSPDGKTIATCSDDTDIRLWDAQTGALLRTLAGHQGRVTHIAFSPDSSWLVSGADDNTLRRWNVVDGTLLDTLQLGDENWRVELLEVLQDNVSVVYRISRYPSPYTGYVQKQILWNTQSSESRSIGTDKIHITQFANDRQHFGAYSDNSRMAGTLQADGSLSVTDAFRSPYGNGALTLPAISPNHRLVVSGNGFGLQAWELSGSTLTFIDLLAADQPMPSYGNEYLFSPDGKYLAFTSGGVAYLLGVPTE